MALHGRRRIILDSGSIAAVTDKIASRPDLSASFHSTSTTGSAYLPAGCVFYDVDLGDIEHAATVFIRANDVAIFIEDVDWIVEPNYPIGDNRRYP